MENDKIVIDVQITPKKPLEYITLSFTMDKWGNIYSINKNRQNKIKFILDEYKKDRWKNKQKLKSIHTKTNKNKKDKIYSEKIRRSLKGNFLHTTKS